MYVLGADSEPPFRILVRKQYTPGRPPALRSELDPAPLCYTRHTMTRRQLPGTAAAPAPAAPIRRNRVFPHYHGMWNPDELYDIRKDPDQRNNLLAGVRITTGGGRSEPKWKA